MKYCNKCFYPDSKPDLYFVEGTCSACLEFEKRKEIDWSARETQFLRMVTDIRRDRNCDSPYDCIVPVSGGKDSHYQVIKCLKVGLKPLAVYATTDDITPIGRKNVENISTLCDLIEVSVDKTTRRRIAKYALQTVGDISWAEHVTIFTVPFREAAIRNIKYVIYGENSQNEYGGPPDAAQAQELTQRWLSEFGGLNGLRVSDLLNKGLLTYDDAQYRFPSPNNATALFLGHYYPWDGFQNFVTAVSYDFIPSMKEVEGAGFVYENLDNYQTGIHDFFKYIKFGFGRATDMVNNHIRRGRMTREQGRAHITKWDGQYMDEDGCFTYLGRSWVKILYKIASTDEFIEIVHRFVNRDLFEIDGLKLYPKFELPKE